MDYLIVIGIYLYFKPGIRMDNSSLEKSHMKLVRGLRRAVWKFQDEFKIVENGD